MAYRSDGTRGYMADGAIPGSSRRHPDRGSGDTFFGRELDAQGSLEPETK